MTSISKTERRTAAIWAEVAASTADAIYTDLFAPVKPVEIWRPHNATDQNLQAAFARGRTILRAVSYEGNSNRWPEDYSGAFVRLDTEAPDQASNREPELHSAVGLLGLIVLSRAGAFQREEDHFGRIILSDLHAEHDAMRRELGITESYAQLRGPWNEEMDRILADPESGGRFPALPHPFPGVTGAQVISAVLDGSLRVGNPNQPVSPTLGVIA